MRHRVLYTVACLTHLRFCTVRLSKTLIPVESGESQLGLDLGRLRNWGNTSLLWNVLQQPVHYLWWQRDATWSSEDGDHGARIPTTPQLVAAVLLLSGGERTYADRVESKWTSARDIVIYFRSPRATLGKETFSNFVFLIYFGVRYFTCK